MKNFHHSIFTLGILFNIFVGSIEANEVELIYKIAQNNAKTIEIQDQILSLQDSLLSSEKKSNQKFADLNKFYNELELELNQIDVLRKKTQDSTKVSKGNSNKIKNIENEIKTILLNNTKNYNGSLFILISLLFEVPAVIFLSSTSFINTQKDVFTLENSPNMIGNWGSGLEPLDTKIGYLSFIALFSLFVGFGLQFIGIIHILTLSLESIVVSLSIFFILSYGIIYYLLGLGEQKRGEKLKTVLRNTLRLLLRLMKLEKKRCDYCLKKIHCNEADVWWIEHASSEPYRGVVLLGHEECLGKFSWFDPKRELKIHKSKLNDFLKIHVKQIQGKIKEKNSQNSRMTYPESVMSG